MSEAVFVNRILLIYTQVDESFHEHLTFLAQPTANKTS
jgi:hypothetical protein